MQTASIFTPQNDTLETRVNATKKVKRAMDDIQASIKHSKAKGYDSALGTEEELKEALEISQNSYKQAVQSLSDADLKKAKRENLLTTEEFQKLSVEKHKTKVQAIRSEQNSQSHTKDHPHKK